MIQSLRTSGSVAILSLLFPPSCSSLLHRLLCFCVCLICLLLAHICLLVSSLVCTSCSLLPFWRLLPFFVACRFLHRSRARPLLRPHATLSLRRALVHPSLSCVSAKTLPSLHSRHASTRPRSRLTCAPRPRTKHRKYHATHTSVRRRGR